MKMILFAFFVVNLSFVTSCAADDAIYISKTKKVRAVFSKEYFSMYASGRGKYYEEKPIWQRSLSSCASENLKCVVSDRFLFAVPLNEFNYNDVFFIENYEIKIEKCLDKKCETSIISSTCLNWYNAECSKLIAGVKPNKVKFSTYRYNIHYGIEWIKLVGGVNLNSVGHRRLFQDAR